MLLHAQALAQPVLPPLDQEALAWLGDRIFSNECNRELRCLTSWNAGEEFPSLGIGHFIWYRAGQQERFVETFPALLTHLQQQGVQLPAWILLHDFEQPWDERDAFLQALDETELTELRTLLLQTMPQQTDFILQRFTAGLPALLQTLPEAERAQVSERIARIIAADARYGSYALIDYVHFKGEGSNPTERYAGTGWGLLQVLQGMPDDSTAPLADFVASARRVLATRVANAPPERNEQRWLAGWNKRLDTYLAGQPAVPATD